MRQHYFRFYLLFVALIGQFYAAAQITAEPRTDIEVRSQNSTLNYAWTGGLNAPQFSAIDLNFDGKKDLFVFDREGNRVMTFINNGSTGQMEYTYDPSYASYFPEMFSWCLLVDYNNDGKEDIFTSSEEGVKVYLNTSSTGMGISFQDLGQNYLESYEGATTKNKIAIPSQDLPAIADLDGDGDIDILTFGTSSTAVIYHENFAADSGNLEAFHYAVNTYCWGKFEESPVSNAVTLQKSCPKSARQAKHAGGTMLAFDPDSDGDHDLLLGDLFYSTMTYLKNGGDPFIAEMVSQDTTFPSSDVSIDLEMFPAAFYVDVDNDGKKDLLIAPNTHTNMEDQRGVIFYKNTGNGSTVDFTFQSRDFLQNEMIDLGTGAYPVFFDHDFNGIMDLIVGNYGIYNGALSAISKLHLYQNTGTKSQPSFQLNEEDYAGLSTMPLYVSLNIPTLNIAPAFGDLTGDGLNEMIVGDYDGKVHYFENAASGISQFQLKEAVYHNIDVGRYATPQLFDLDRDGLNDLIIGEADGNINYYRNTGSILEPDFTFITDSLGGITTSEFFNYPGYSQPCFFRSQNETYLLVGGESGKIRLYSDITGNLTGKFTLMDSALFNIDVGRRSTVTITDLDNDGFFDLAVGNFAGGLNLFSTDQTVGLDKLTSSNHSFYFNAYSVSKNEVYVSVSEEFDGSLLQLEVHTIDGKRLSTSQFSRNTTLDVSSWPNGLYLFSVNNGTTFATEKLILNR